MPNEISMSVARAVPMSVPVPVGMTAVRVVVIVSMRMSCPRSNPRILLKLLHATRVQLSRIGTSGLETGVREGLDDRL